MNSPNYKVIEADVEWADRYRKFCQQAYLRAYTRPDLGITSDLFSDKLFDAPRVVRMFENTIRKTPVNQAWLAVGDNNEILGGVAVRRYPGHCTMKSFYVDPSLQGRGIGHALYARVLEFAGSLPIEVDVVEYMQSTIDMYKHWGFAIDPSKGKLIYDIPEWPEAARQTYHAVYLVKPAE